MAVRRPDQTYKLGIKAYYVQSYFFNLKKKKRREGKTQKTHLPCVSKSVGDILL